MILEIALVASSSVLLVCLAIKEIRRQKQFAQLRTDFEKVRTLLYREITERSVESVQRSKARRDFKDKMESVHNRLDSHEAAFGGLWKTAKGHVVQVRDMSDGHLINSIEYVKTHPSFFPSGKSEKLIGMFKAEQDRRATDRKWRDTDRIAKPDGTLISDAEAIEDWRTGMFNSLVVQKNDIGFLRTDLDCLRSDVDALTDLTREVWARAAAKKRKKK